MDGAGVRAPVDHSGQRPRTALEAAWRDVDCELPRDGVSAGGADELPRATGVGRGGRDTGDVHAGGTGPRIQAGKGDGVAGSVRYRQTGLAEPALLENAADCGGGSASMAVLRAGGISRLAGKGNCGNCRLVRTAGGGTPAGRRSSGSIASKGS